MRGANDKFHATDDNYRNNYANIFNKEENMFGYDKTKDNRSMANNGNSYYTDEYVKHLEERLTIATAALAKDENSLKWLHSNLGEVIVSSVNTPLSVFGGVSLLDFVVDTQSKEGVIGTLLRIHGGDATTTSLLEYKTKISELEKSIELLKEDK